MGHHVLLDLVPDWGLRGRVRELLCRAVGDESARWGAWADEIFADLWGLLTIGPWSLWALADVVAADDQRMVAATRAAGSYPPPAVRLALLIALANRLDVPCGVRVLRAYGLRLRRMVTRTPPGESAGAAKQRAQAAGELGQVAMVARTLLETEFDLGDAVTTLPALASWTGVRPDFQPGGAVAAWAADWLEAAPRPIAPGASAVRLVMASAVEAWARAVTDQRRPDAAARVRDNQRSRLPATILEVREGTERADAIAFDRPVGGLGTSLVEAALTDRPESESPGE
jgi:hypothetical protein